jgi:hypothetical protein
MEMDEDAQNEQQRASSESFPEPNDSGGQKPSHQGLPEVTPTSSTGPATTCPVVDHLSLAASNNDTPVASCKTDAGGLKRAGPSELVWNDDVLVKEEEGSEMYNGDGVEQRDYDMDINGDDQDNSTSSNNNEDQIANDVINFLESTQGLNDEHSKETFSQVAQTVASYNHTTPARKNTQTTTAAVSTINTTSMPIPEHAPYVPPLPHNSTSSLTAPLEQHANCPSTPVNPNNQYYQRSQAEQNQKDLTLRELHLF